MVTDFLGSLVVLVEGKYLRSGGRGGGANDGGPESFLGRGGVSALGGRDGA